MAGPGRGCAPGGLPGVVGRWGTKILLLPPLNVSSLLFCFLVSYEESNSKDPVAVTEPKEGTEASTSKGLEKKEK